jgi:hypothetical protein
MPLHGLYACFTVGLPKQFTRKGYDFLRDKFPAENLSGSE